MEYSLVHDCKEREVTTMKRCTHGERGQVLMLILVALVVIIGCVAISGDVGFPPWIAPCIYVCRATGGGFECAVSGRPAIVA